METAIADDNLGELKAVHESIITNLRELVKLDKFKKGYTVVTDVVERLQEKKQKLLVDKTEMEGVKKRNTELEIFLREANDEFTQYNEVMVRKYI